MKQLPGPSEGEAEQTLLSHLIELRARLLRAVLAVLAVFLLLMPFANRLYAAIAEPMIAKLPAGASMIAVDVASPFFAPIKLAFVAAITIAMPAILYQAWAFVAPGLYQHERRLALPILVAATSLFYIGAAFAYFLVLPAVFTFLTAVSPEGVQVAPDISAYLNFVLVVFLAFGFSFEVPVAVVILGLLRWVSVEQLREARPYVIVGAFVVAAIITPPDVISQLMLAIPMALLYELGIIATRMLLARQPAQPSES
ncbi:twin-arginine translocase subunit TatC [Aquimonas voraii]|uniref:Sec-independent protein translocase protein TatC n=1 Tax=Aquimonas voraii TaxID=265719 RepID=A0A1G6UIF1_9GAMM|nr:twin-arginine translocase subunit TatC [Aquimonas voraii]SDD40315.1 Sec-independent protein translocase TatC [Aquimonas voraii]